MIKKLFTKGDIIMTNPKQGYYGVAVVLDDAIPHELSPGRLSYPMNHILITPLLFTNPISMDDICIQDLKPLVHAEYFNNRGKLIFWRNKICIDIYTNRNKAKLHVIGNIDTSNIGEIPPLLWTPMDDRFHLCGDVDWHFGIEAYIEHCRMNNLEL